MNQVQQLRQHFEKLKTPDKDLNEVQKLSPKTIGPLSPFKRSKTSLEIIKNCDKNVNHDNSDNSFINKCLKRSPAFRFNQDKTRASVHSHPGLKSSTAAIKKLNQNVQDELQYLSTSETIKRALLKPLPIGLPPKKPPRIFNKSSENSPSVSSSSSSSTPNKEIADEVIYMEPFAHLKMSTSPVKEPEQLHYMCTDLNIGQSPQQLNNNSNNSNRRLSASNQNDTNMNEKNSIEKVRNFTFLLFILKTYNSILICFCRSTYCLMSFMMRKNVSRR